MALSNHVICHREAKPTQGVMQQIGPGVPIQHHYTQLCLTAEARITLLAKVYMAALTLFSAFIVYFSLNDL